MSAPRERTENASKENQSAFSFDDDLKMLAEEFDELSFRRCALEHAQQQAQELDALTGPDEPMPEPDFAALDQLMESSCTANRASAGAGDFASRLSASPESPPAFGIVLSAA